MSLPIYTGISKCKGRQRDYYVIIALNVVSYKIKSNYGVL